MKRVFLHGRMGKLLGKEWTLDVSSPAEAVRAIESATHKLYEYLRRCTDRNIGFHVVVGKDCAMSGPADLLSECMADEIHFYPTPYGADSSKTGSWLQVIIGVVLIVVGAILTIKGGWQVGVPMMLSGASMIFGGVTSLMQKNPAIDKPNEENASYLFSGAVNTVAQGGPIPMGYGEMLIGSQVVSFSVRSYAISRKGYVSNSTASAFSDWNAASSTATKATITPDNVIS